MFVTYNKLGSLTRSKLTRPADSGWSAKNNCQIVLEVSARALLPVPYDLNSNRSTTYFWRWCPPPVEFPPPRDSPYLGVLFEVAPLVYLYLLYCRLLESKANNVPPKQLLRILFQQRADNCKMPRRIKAITGRVRLRIFIARQHAMHAQCEANLSICPFVYCPMPPCRYCV